jgi:prepilin peptidase CpaA
MTYPASQFALLSALLAIAAASDVARHRISNEVAVAVAVGGLSAQAVVHGMLAGATGLAASIIVAALIWPAWSRRMIGGGDLKLAAAAAAWVGLERLPTYLVSAGVAMGVLACLAYATSSLRARSEMRSNVVAVALGANVAGVPLTAERGRVVVPAGAAFAMSAVFALVTGGTP